MIAREISSRSEEAMLAGAGCSVPPGVNCDFRLERSGQNEWIIHIKSVRASEWLHEELCDPLCRCVSNSMVVDLLSADRFLKKAHRRGFRTEFVGRSGGDLY